MLLTAVEIKGRSASIAWENNRHTATAKRTFHVRSPSQIFGFDMVAGLPSLGASYPQYSGTALLCSSVEATESEQLDNGEWLWTVTANYTNVFDEEPNDNEPLDRDPRLNWSSRLVEVSPEDNQDLDGKTIVNTAGDPFLDPAPVILEPHVILDVGFNMSTSAFSGGWALSWLNTVNSQSWKGGDADTVLIEDIKASLQFEEYYYWKVSMTFHFNPRKWIPFRIASRGYGYYKTVNGAEVYKYASDDDDIHSTGPVYLDGVGHMIPRDTMKLLNVSPYFLNFRLYQRANFAVLGF